MTTPVPGITIDRQYIEPLDQNWRLAATAPGACADPAQALAQNLYWREAVVPGTVAVSLDADLDQGDDYDACDWWYRCTFAAPRQNAVRLRCDGLATLAEVWLNGTLLLVADNMFLPWAVDISAHLRAENELAICFRSLRAALSARRARPRWKTALVDQQPLRWFRTTLLGRIPGWTPALAPVGPWQGIRLEGTEQLEVLALDLQTGARAGVAALHLAATLRSRGEIRAASLCLGGRRHALGLDQSGDTCRLDSDLVLDDVPLWWPHTHGEPALLDCRIELEIEGETLAIDCGRVGFKDIAVDRSGGAVRFVVNGIAVFCRGACWTCGDIKALVGSPARLREALTLARAAGANMLRIGGTMTYESDAFYALCDELGLLVWQDFMFANMDYPVADDGFRANIEREARFQLQRLQRHPCIAAYCGGSEIEQQAAMLGLPAGEWSNDFFSEALPRLCAQLHAGIPYFRGSPSEGALPFHTASGIAHYYGVGAYRRPLADVKLAQVKFGAETLGFANVPEPETMALMLHGATPMPHHPAWKAGVPRDNGAGLDFEDVRDHYLKLLFDLDPVQLRSRDVERYYALSRAVSGEVMGRVFSEWRRTDSECGGALVWFFNDLRPGAGWGIIDSENRPKAAYHYLKRAWARRTVRITDEGLNGLQLHVINESAAPLAAGVELEVFQAGRIRIAAATTAVAVAPHSTLMLESDALLGHFSDITYAYRFGPPGHDIVVARLVADSGATLGEDVYFPQGLNLPYQDAAQIRSSTRVLDDSVIVTLESDCFLQTVHVDSRDYMADDNYFHLAPNRKKQIRFSPAGAPGKKFKCHFSALNLRESITVRADEPA